MEAIRNKYKGAKFMKVADLPELKGEVEFLMMYIMKQFLAGIGTNCGKKTMRSLLARDLGEVLPGVQDRWAFRPFLTPRDVTLGIKYPVDLNL